MPKLSRNLISLLFPAQCLGCETDLRIERSESRTSGALEIGTEFDIVDNFDRHWCRQCWRDVTEDVTRPTCFKCGVVLQTRNPFPGRCALCHDLDLRFSRAVAIGNYHGVLQRLVIQMKNQKDEQLAIQLGFLLAYRLREMDFMDDVDVVLPVSTHWWTRLRRGFHSAEIIADAIGSAMKIPVWSKVLQSLRTTRKQGTLSTPGRFANVRKAFGLRRGFELSDMSVLVVDDVMTSGATVSEIAKVLFKAGAARVYIGVLARGARVS